MAVIKYKDIGLIPWGKEIYYFLHTNPAHEGAFKLLISDSRKKNPLWDRTSVNHGSATRVLFTEENSDGEF